MNIKLAAFITSSLMFSMNLFATELNPDNPVNDEVIAQSDADNGIAGRGTGLPIRPVVGNKKVLLVIGKWADGSTTDPNVQWQQVFSDSPDSLRSFVKDSSQGKLLLEPVKTANGRYMLIPDFGEKPSSCTFNDMLNRARNAADAEGIPASDYDYLFVAVKCQGGALASAPGQNIVLFGQGGSSHVWLHEFGHNLGTSHPDMYINCPTEGDTVETPDRCGVRATTDPGDPVGGGRSPYPAVTRAFAGWLQEGKTLSEITTSGRYGLGSLGKDGPQLYYIKLPQQNRYLTLEYRDKGDDNTPGGVWLRYSSIGGSVKSSLVNATSEDTSLKNPQLRPGKTLQDSSGIRVHVCSANSQEAVVSVALNGEILPGCTASLEAPHISSPEKNAPVTYKPLFSGTAAPGAGITVVKSHSPQTVLATTKAGSNGVWSVLSNISLPEGNYSVSARQTMGSVLSSWSANQPFVVVPLSLNAPSLVIPEKNSKTTQLPIFVGKDAIPGAEVVVVKSFNPDYVVGRTVADAKGLWQVMSSRLPVGNFSVAVRQTFDGKTSSWSGNTPFSVESLSVDPVGIVSPEENATTGRTPEISGTALPGASVVIVKSNNPGTILGSANADARGHWSSTLVTLPVGPYSISARQTFDGKTSSWSTNRRFTVSEKMEDIPPIKSH
ncbi:hypothetical protein FE394_04305 [Xenorhabdus sp. Reich]|uniref:Uncharacterized protein n=1 Tax=Xenorhabdus littoralis TaxID=2582835 RepID=A0ABU4SIF1_9GAMM|nr:hypothetical protein [Xenorhabdus sp. Reich]MDX7998437.1 hypothetical protein [Xenorhabdus sp. Reich]